MIVDNYCSVVDYRVSCVVVKTDTLETTTIDSGFYADCGIRQANCGYGFHAMRHRSKSRIPKLLLKPNVVIGESSKDIHLRPCGYPHLLCEHFLAVIFEACHSAERLTENDF